MTRANAPRSMVIALCLVLARSSSAFALNPSLDVSQYAHTSWKIDEGFGKGRISSIAQSADGYLSLATGFGLLRFDGVRTVPWESPTGEQLPSTDVRSSRWARDGTLWIGTSRGLVIWNGGKLAHYPKFDGQVIETLLEDPERTMWTVAGFALSTSKLCRIQDGRTELHIHERVSHGHAASWFTTVRTDD